MLLALVVGFGVAICFGFFSCINCLWEIPLKFVKFCQ